MSTNPTALDREHDPNHITDGICSCDCPRCTSDVVGDPVCTCADCDPVACGLHGEAT